MPTVLKKVQLYNKPQKSEVPITVVWKNARMVRIHSIRATVREILNLSDSLDVVKVNIIGTPSTGKTELSKTLAHLCHKMAKIPYTIRVFTRDDLFEFEDTLKSLEPTNHVLIFDDISFMSATAGKRQIDKIQKAFTEIRHLPGGQDVKIIAIFNFHYNMAVSKYMRQSDFFYYTSVGTSELENTQNVVGKKYTAKILEFRRVNQQALTTKKYTFKLGKKGQRFDYDWRKPYAPLLFWNNDTLRIVVFPKSTWIDPHCTLCSNSKKELVSENIDLEKFDDGIKTQFGIGVIRQALRIRLFNMGINTYAPSVKRCMAYLEQFVNQNNCNYEQLIIKYELKNTGTRLAKNLNS